MAIGSRVPGSSVIAGQYGIISAEGQPVALSQTVRLIDPAATLITLSQSVQQIDRARQIVTLQQRVLGAGVAPSEVTPPAAYVIINGTDVTAMTALDTVRITFNEDQAATASMFLFVEMGAQVNIPSFHGKSIRIETHSDPSDIESEIVPLFTGWIETARHDRARGGIDIQATDLRDERLGDDADAITASLQLDGARYSPVTQKEKAEGRELVTEYLKTYPGSVGYMRNGMSHYYTWGTQKNGVDKYISKTFGNADVAYADIETEFQTRSSVKNTINIDLDMRYYALRQFFTYVTYKMSPSQKRSSGGAFSFDSQVSKANSYSPWQTMHYYVYGSVTTVITGAPGTPAYSYVIYPARGKADGHWANIGRLIAQPVVERYKIKVTAPQSVAAYGKEIEGSNVSFAVESEYEPSRWESEFNLRERHVRRPNLSDGQFYGTGSRQNWWWLPGVFYTDSSLQNQIAAEKKAAQGDKTVFYGAWNAAVAIAKKEIVQSHRQNYVNFKRYQIDAVDVGDIVQLDTRIVQTKGQVSGITYTISDGLRQTDYRLSISYMDTDVTAPVENTEPPEIEYIDPSYVELSSSTIWQTEKGFETKLPDISETYTDEREIEKPVTLEVAVEINDITLINGY